MDKVNNKVDDVSVDNFLGTSGVYTSPSGLRESSLLSKFSDDFSASEKWIDSREGRQEATSSFDLSARKSQNPRNRESADEISEKDRTEPGPEVSKTSFTRSVHQRKILRMLREAEGGATDQGWENSFRPRQEERLASEKWTSPSDNTEEQDASSVSSSHVSSHDFLAERLGARPERSIDNDHVSDEEDGQASIPYNHLPLHLARNDQSDEKCNGRDCVNSLNSDGRELESAKPFRRSSNSDHRGVIENNEDAAGDKDRDKEDDSLLVTPNPTAERRRLKVIQSARKLQNSIKTFKLDKDLFTVFQMQKPAII